MYSKSDDTFALSWAKKIKVFHILGGKCKTCNTDNIKLIEFHHLNPDIKETTWARLRDKRWSNIEIELKKCIPLCSNCHIEKHAIDGGRGHVLKNKILKLSGFNHCKKCQYSGVGLEFHHKENKNFNIGDVVGRKINVSMEILLNELDKCDVICRNCHKLEHIDYDRFDRLKELIDFKVNNYSELQRPLDVKEIKLLFATGMKKIDIARKIKCAKSTISSILNTED